MFRHYCSSSPSPLYCHNSYLHTLLLPISLDIPNKYTYPTPLVRSSPCTFTSCHTCSLKPRLSSPAFVSQKSNFSPKVQHKIQNGKPGSRLTHSHAHTYVSRHTQEVRGPMPPQSLALKVGVVTYLITIILLVRHCWLLLYCLAIFVRRILGLRLLNLCFHTYILFRSVAGGVT